MHTAIYKITYESMPYHTINKKMKITTEAKTETTERQQQQQKNCTQINFSQIKPGNKTHRKTEKRATA